MLVHIFGAKPSPSVVGYVLRKVAQDNKEDFWREVVDAVNRDFYVDDHLFKSFPDSQHAIDSSKQLQYLLARGGFELTKWISYSRSVLSAFPVAERAPQIKNLHLGSVYLLIELWESTGM